jgi:glycosyltransferase involved in cell wall biosynthesis
MARNHRPRLRDKMKNLLFVSIYPFPVDMGSKQHAYYFLKAFSGLYNVYCVFFIPPHRESPLDADSDLAGLNIKAYQLCHFNKPVKMGVYTQHFRNIIEFPISYMNLATHRQGLQIINTFIERYAINIVHFEHFWLTKYARFIRQDLKKVVVYHDLHHNIFRQLAKLEKKYHKKIIQLILQLKLYAYESMLNKQVSLKIFLNPLEMQAFPENSVHLPHIANKDIIYNSVRTTDFFNILFLGAYKHPPNRRSVEFIINNILPQLAKVQENFKIHITGPGTEKFQNLLVGSRHRKHVIINGFKHDINQAFENMDIALYPILDGGGIKTKIIDTMASGIPVVTTPKGLEGLHNLPKDCVSTGKTSEELVNEIHKLMRNYPLRSERSIKAKSYIDTEHSFDVLLKKLMQCYSNL